MIISASRRTDIPAFYADWFFNRLEEGFTLTRNPMNFHQVSRIALSEDVVDGFVFWTKNPIPMADRLEQLGSIPFYFQFTLTPYGPDLEPGVPDKQAWMIPAFQQLARQIGPERLVWRYDPIVLTPAYTADFHLQAFRSMAQQLSGCTDTCVISFYDSYSHLNRTARELGMRPPTREEIRILAGKMGEIAAASGMRLTSCTETVDLSAFGISHGKCIDGERLSRIGSIPLLTRRDPNQRSGCGCDLSIDIGMYDCCGHACRYCYANHATAAIRHNLMVHDPSAPLLYGAIGEDDRIRDRDMPSFRDTQLRFL